MAKYVTSQSMYVEHSARFKRHLLRENDWSFLYSSCQNLEYHDYTTGGYFIYKCSEWFTSFICMYC